MKLIAAILLVSCAACATTTPPPPVPVEVKIAVPIPCQIEEPTCASPAYDQATKAMPMDQRAKLLRVEAIEQADCISKYKDALAACRAPSPQ